MKTPKPNSRRSLLTGISVGILAALCSTAHAADIDWNGDGSDNNFSTPENWIGEVVPGAGDTAFIGSGTVTIDSNQTVNYIEAGRWGGTATLTHSSGTLTTGGFNVGFYGTGNYTLNGDGSISAANDAFIGHGTGTGTLTIDTTGTASFGYVHIANTTWGADDYPTGTLTINNGTLTSTGGFAIGGNGGTGTLEINGGTVISNGWVSVGNDPGGSTSGTASGIVNQSAGSLTINNTLALANVAGSDGTYNLTGGTLSVTGEFRLGQHGTGEFNQSGGTASSEGFFLIGSQTGSEGTYNLTGGTVNAATNWGQTILGSQADSTGTLNVSGGTFNATNDIIVGEAWTNTGTATGVINISGTGTVTTGVSGGVILGLNDNGEDRSSSGTINLNSGGTLQTGYVTKGAGTGEFNFDGGVLRASQSHGNFISGLTEVSILAGGAIIDTNGHDITIGVALTGDGDFTKLGTGTLALTSFDNAFTGDIRIEAGTLSINSAFIADTASVYVLDGATFNLDFFATDTISSLFFDGVAQAIGSYGALDSGADFEVSWITGDGFLYTTAVPEPSTLALLAGLAGLGFGASRRRRRA